MRLCVFFPRQSWAGVLKKSVFFRSLRPARVGRGVFKTTIMFGTQFYPTPDELADRMVAPFADLEPVGRFRVLDPSAGSGSLLAAVSRAFDDCEGLELTGIEIDSELCAMCNGKGYRTHLADFMDCSGMDRYDLIVMNPPFADGAKHVVKAWGKLRGGGNLAALVNAADLNKPARGDHRRRLQQLISVRGTSTILRGAFSDAQRKTDVDVALIYLHKPEPVKEKPLFDPVGMDYRDKIEQDRPIEETEVATRNEARNLVLDYDAAVMAYLEMKRAERRYDRYKRRVAGYDPMSEGSTDQVVYDRDIAELTRKAWDRVLRMSKIKLRMSSKAQREFDLMVSDQYGLAFTEKNIYNLLQQMVEASGSIAHQCIMDAYDMLTKYSEKNLDPKKRWKTNNAYRINKRVILPCPIGIDVIMGRWKTSNWYDSSPHRSYVTDLDRALCHLTGKRIEDVVSVCDGLNKAVDGVPRHLVEQVAESEFFTMRFYKKGTAHLTFKDQDLLDRFNIYVAKERGWLQEGEGIAYRQRVDAGQTSPA